MPVESGITALAQRVGLEIKTLKAASIVADVVACYDNTSTGHTGSETDIAHYDTSSLTDKDIVLVLKDETNEDQKAYYRYDKANDALGLEVAEDKIDHPIATATTFGAVKPDGTTITINNGVLSYNLPTATATRLGGVKIKTNGGLQVTTAGELSVKASALPVATDTALGAVKIDANGGLNIASDGTLSVQTTALPVASDTQLGVVKVDGTTITAASDGTLSAIGGSADVSTLPVATDSALGVVKVDNVTVIVSDDGTLSAKCVASLMPKATYTTLGAVKLTTTGGLKVDNYGNLSGLTATNARIGMVKVDGTTIQADSDGTISVVSGGGISSVDDIPVASTTTNGVVSVDGTTIKVTSTGQLYVMTTYPLGYDDSKHAIGMPNFKEEKWELTMEDGSTVTRVFMVAEAMSDGS